MTVPYDAIADVVTYRADSSLDLHPGTGHPLQHGLSHPSMLGPEHGRGEGASLRGLDDREPSLAPIALSCKPTSINTIFLDEIFLIKRRIEPCFISLP